MNADQFMGGVILIYNVVNNDKYHPVYPGEIMATQPPPGFIRMFKPVSGVTSFLNTGSPPHTGQH